MRTAFYAVYDKVFCVLSDGETCFNVFFYSDSGVGGAIISLSPCLLTAHWGFVWLQSHCSVYCDKRSLTFTLSTKGASY